ncbi:uncharacterized protein LOC123694454 [Colias croceus]|uniref:uncharacterized protein LOC123694454 n=1 Tax=Colias crocea TaxID=72248 RepID=UPI001E27B8A0|nr:uncharacterized protein LOC123694454 [Colias croceus]
MPTKKCANCNKNITLKQPGLECSRCNKSVHASTVCAKLTGKQLAALRNSDGLEWSCDHCLSNVSSRSSFFVTPDESSDDEDARSSSTLDQKKLVASITREMQKIIKAELGDLTTAMEHMNGQMTDLEELVKRQENTIKTLLNKNTDLINKNKNLELRIAAAEQHINEIDQKLLACTIEIAGVPEATNQNLNSVLESVAQNLQVNICDVLSSRRMPKPQNRPQPGNIIVEVKSNVVRNQWLASAKQKEITVGDILPRLPSDQATRRVFVREALTHRTKTLLYNAQQKLKDSYKFVWCKAGVVYAKKLDDKSRPFIIRSLSDIESLLSK